MIHRVRAVNEPGSANLVHDDLFARRLGFRGGLVPGVTLYGYLAALPLERWGAGFWAGGTMSARFLKPVYDGEEVAAAAEDHAGGLELSLRNPEGEVCANGAASGPAVPEPVDASAYPSGRPPAEPGPPAFRDGQALGAVHAELRLGDPGWPARLGNTVLMANAQLPPWMHVETRTRHLAQPPDVSQVEVRALVVGAWERRGHRFVDLDVVVLAEAGRPLAQLRHVAIVELAQLREQSSTG